MRLDSVVRLLKQPITFKAVCVHVSFSNLRQKRGGARVGTLGKDSKAARLLSKGFLQRRFRKLPKFLSTTVKYDLGMKPPVAQWIDPLGCP